MRNDSALLFCAISGVLCVPSAAWGQATSGQPAASVLEEVVVTAQKRAESLQDVAIAISAFTGEARDLIGITTIGDLTDFTPGLSYASSLDRMSLRGVGRLTNNYGSDPGIATYSDGFYTASNVEAGKRPIHTARIEVLRGPQGTLYGRNSIGGALNVISVRPTDTFYGEVRATFGNYDTQIYEGAVSGPITDWLRFRLSGNTGGQGRGFFRDEDSGETEGGLAGGGRNDDFYVEGQLEFNVGDRFEGWFKYARAGWDQARRTTVLITPQDVAPVYFGGLFPNVTYNGPQAGSETLPPVSAASTPYTPTNPSLRDRRLYNTDTPFRTRLDDTHIYTLELVGHMGWADLKYVGGYQGYTYRQVSDFDGTQRGPYTVTVGVNAAQFTIYPQIEAFYMEDKEYYSNELNLISTHDGPLQWILGLYQYHEQVNQPSGVRAPLQAELENPAASALTPTVPGPPNPERILQVSGAFLDADARAVFGQIDYSFANNWKATLGLRYTEDRKDAEEFRTRALYGFATRLTSGPLAGQWVGLPYAFYSEIDRRNLLSGKWHATTGTAGLEWSPDEDTLTFVKYTRGYKSGGFNAGAFAGDAAYTDPEFINAYEFGVKRTFMDRLTANLSLFYYDYRDPQFPSTVRDPVTNLNESRFFNIEKGESIGAEFEGAWAVNDDFEIRLTYAWLDTKIKDKRCFIDNDDTGVTGVFVAPDARPCAAPTPGQQTGQLIDGDGFPSTPEHKIALNANYTWRTGAGALTLSGTWTYRDEAYYSVFNRAHNLAPSYDETDLRALWRDARDRYTLIAFVRNLFDEEGYEAASAGMSAWGVQSRSLTLTPPRTYGVEVQFRFGE